jgi:hypothetical protein
MLPESTKTPTNKSATVTSLTHGRLSFEVLWRGIAIPMASLTTRMHRRRIRMSKFQTKTAAFVAHITPVVVLSLGFAMTATPSATAKDGPGAQRAAYAQSTVRARRQHLANLRCNGACWYGYASSIESRRGFAPGKEIVDDTCDLPSSGCWNDKRITN